MKYQGITKEKEALEAVKNDGYTLRYVKDQSEAVCLEAVKSNGNAPQYVLAPDLFEKLAKLFNL